MIKGWKNNRQGFALPVIIIASTVCIAILVGASAVAASVRGSLTNAYYLQLANEAAEAGMARAQSCLRSNNFIPQWNTSTPLTPSSDCSGVTLSSCASGCFVVDTPTLKTTFSSGTANPTPDGSIRVQVTGEVQLRRASNPSVTWKTIPVSHTRVDRYANQPQLGAGAGWGASGHIGYMISRDGYLYGFGDNSAHQISDTDQTPILTPVLMALPDGVTRVKQLVTSGKGASIICIIGSDDQAYCRGLPGAANEEGLLDYNIVGWQKFSIPARAKTEVSKLSIHGQGGDALCALTFDSYMYCAGQNYMYDGRYGALGGGNTTDQRVPLDRAEKFLIPGNLQVKDVYVQDKVSCAITLTDALYCAGNNLYGTLGDGGSAGSATPLLYPLPGGRKPVQVVSSYHDQPRRILHVLANDGTIWGSGLNTYGELGDGTTTVQRTPVQFGSRDDYVSVISSEKHFCGITKSGSVYCAGDNTYGQLGTGVCSTVPQTSPVLFSLPAGERARPTVSGSNMHQADATIILTESGKIYSAGRDEFGRFGSGSIGAGADFAQCSVVQAQLPAGVTATSVSTNDQYSMYFMGSDGRPYAMGRNNQGQLGDGTTNNSTTPRNVRIPRVGVVY